MNRVLFLMALASSFPVFSSVTCPVAPPAGTLCINSGQTFQPEQGWKGTSVLVMADNSTIKLLPSLNGKWVINIGKGEFGNNAVIDLSGNDAIGAPSKAGQVTGTPNCQHGYEGYLGATGYPGESTAELQLAIENLAVDNLIIRRQAGNGGQGGEGGNGDTGGHGDCLHCGCNGQPGGFGGKGGKGGRGGKINPVTIIYGSLIPYSSSATIIKTTVSDQATLISPGIIDTRKRGYGGEPGSGGWGGRGGGNSCQPLGCGGDGEHRNHYRGGNLGRGDDGNETESFIVKQR